MCHHGAVFYWQDEVERPLCVHNIPNQLESKEFLARKN